MKHFLGIKKIPSIQYVLKHERKLVVIYLALKVNCKLIPIRKPLISIAPGSTGHSRYVIYIFWDIVLGESAASRNTNTNFSWANLLKTAKRTDMQTYPMQMKKCSSWCVSFTKWQKNMNSKSSLSKDPIPFFMTLETFLKPTMTNNWPSIYVVNRTDDRWQ